MSDSLSRIHEELSLEGHEADAMNTPFEADLFMPSINLSILYGNKIFTIPISSFASNCKNRQQIQAIQTDVSDSKNR